MKAVFDTCALHDDLSMTGLASRTVLQQATQGKFGVVIPQVVLVEMANKARIRIEAATEKMMKGGFSLKKLGVANGVRPPEHTALTKQFTDELRTRLGSAGAVIAPIPKADHRDLVARSVLGRKPFRESGVGYRDALIWLNVLEAAESDDVVFVSGNTNDFADDFGELHPHLKGDLATAGCPNSVTLVTSLESFIEDYVPPADQALAEARHLFSDPTSAKELEGELLKLVGDHDHWPYHSQVTLVRADGETMRGEDSPQMIQVEEVDILGVEIEGAVEFDPEDQTAVLDIRAKAELVLELVFEQGDAEWLIERKADISFHDFEHNESYAAGQTTVFVAGELRALFKQGEDRVDQLEFISMDDLPEDDPVHPAAQGREAQAS